MNNRFLRIILPSCTFLLIIILIGCITKSNPLENKKVCIDPGHGGTAAIDFYRVGPTGEREEWINLRVAKKLKKLLEDKNCQVIMTRATDIVIPLKDRALIAVNNKADVFISLHHNATADKRVNFPTVYFHGNASENRASVLLGQCLVRHLKASLFDDQHESSLVSDYTIFPNSGTAVLRHSYGIPGVIGEASFFTNPMEEKRLTKEEYNSLEARAYMSALEDYFSSHVLPIETKFSKIKISPFRVLQEADRLNPIASLWQSDFKTAQSIFRKGEPESLQVALDLFTRSVRSFPDSWLAGKAHYFRALILERMNKPDEAAMEIRRASEYYVDWE